MFLQSREHLDLLFSVTVACILIWNTDCLQSCRLLRVVPRPHPHQSSSTYRALWWCNTFWHIIHLSLKISFYYSHHLTEEETKHQRGYVTRLVSHSQNWDLNPNHSVEKLEWVSKFCPRPPSPLIHCFSKCGPRFFPHQPSLGCLQKCSFLGLHPTQWIRISEAGERHASYLSYGQ